MKFIQALHIQLALLHADQRGDNENLGRLLLLAIVLIPLIVLLAMFGDQVVEAATTAWDDIIGSPVDTSR